MSHLHAVADRTSVDPQHDAPFHGDLILRNASTTIGANVSSENRLVVATGALSRLCLACHNINTIADARQKYNTQVVFSVASFTLRQQADIWHTVAQHIW